jgi:hypothetical protein
MHLNADELIDLAEGTRPESSAPHLAGCKRCRTQLGELRAMRSTVVEDARLDVPEPSPLFWDHLSQRVQVAVAADQVPRRSWLDAGAWGRLLLPLSAVAVASLLIALAVGWRAIAPAPAVRPSLASSATATDSAAPADVLADSVPDDDVSLRLVASLTEHLDLDAAGEAGLAPGDSAEHAVTHMSDDDLRELRRVLKEELARSGA